MTVPSYTEDLTDIATGDEAAGWVELTGDDQDAEAYNAQGIPAYEDNEYPYIQGSFAVTQDCTKDTAIGSLAYPVTAITIPTDGAVFIWQCFASAFVLGTYATGGYRICIGSGIGDFNVWYTGGQDKGRMPYGGFENHVVNPTVTRDNWVGATTATINYVGGAVWVLIGPSKGEVHQVDAMRYGRGSAIFEHGEAANYCIISGFAAQNDAQANRWGLIQEQPGGYLWKGRMQLGSITNAVNFRDSNRNIFIDWTPKVTENFNLIEIINSSSSVGLSGFNITCLDTSSASKGRFLMTDAASVSLNTCSFVDMDTFVFNYSSNTVEILDCTFTRCNQVTQGGATFDGCTFSSATSAVSLLVDDLDNIDNCNFLSDGSNHAIELTTDHAGGEYTIAGCTYTNYASVSGSTGNECLYNNSGGAVTINVNGGDSPTIRNGTSASTIVNNPKFFNFTLSPSVTGYEWRLYEVTAVGSLDGSVEMDGEESATDDNQEYAYNYAGDQPIAVQIITHSFGSEDDYVESNTYYTLGSTGQNVTILLTEDDNN